MIVDGANKELRDRERLLRQYRGWFREQVKAARQGPYGERLERLRRFLHTMTIDDGDRLIELVDDDHWRDADADTRFLILRMVDNAIVLLREKRGLPPFDDALEGEPPTAFQIIKQCLFPADEAAPAGNPPAAGATSP
jgi:hypothetical protein